MKGKIVYNRDGSKSFFIDGKEVSEKVFLDAFPDKPLGQVFLANNSPACWPQASEALAVHPSKRKEAYESSVAKGVETQFDKLGRPIFRDRNHRKRYCREYGYFDRQAGYADAAHGDRITDEPDAKPTYFAPPAEIVVTEPMTIEQVMAMARERKCELRIPERR